jgi:hypothetical protein
VRVRELRVGDFRFRRLCVVDVLFCLLKYVARSSGRLPMVQDGEIDGSNRRSLWFTRTVHDGLGNCDFAKICMVWAVHNVLVKKIRATTVKSATASSTFEECNLGWQRVLLLTLQDWTRGKMTATVRRCYLWAYMTPVVKSGMHFTLQGR